MLVYFIINPLYQKYCLGHNYVVLYRYMKKPNVIQFYIQNSDEGGYTASAIGYSIYTQGETLDETVHNIKAAVNCHFDEDENKTKALPIMVNFAVPTLA
mgnify:FL=1